MTVGRILANGIDQGSGFALATPDSSTTRVVLTANHVVGDHSSLQFVTQDGQGIPVERMEGDDDLDVAVLHLGEDVPGGLAVGYAVDGANWKVETQPSPNNPMLEGTITATNLRFKKQDGRHEIDALQLYVKQTLGDFKGYSGSPVVLPPPSGAVIGILVEQFLSRLAGQLGQPRPATNVLYAIPIQAVLDRFALTATSAVPIKSNILPLWGIPNQYQRNLLFTGRDDILQQLHDAFQANDLAASIQALCGLGGIGKTQTALEYAYRYHDDYQFILWAGASSRAVLVSSFLKISRLLKLPEIEQALLDPKLNLSKLSTSSQKASIEGPIVDAVKRWLEAHSGWLLILDNAADLSKIKDLIPSAGHGHVLITTRLQATAPIAQRIEMQVLRQEEGIAFLLRRASFLAAGEALDKVASSQLNTAKEIVTAMGCLPLALDQAGAYIAETRLSLSEYLELYQTERVALLKKRGNMGKDHPEAVETTWFLSFEKVKQANPAAAELLQFCAFLSPDAIPLQVITEGSPALGPVLGPAVASKLVLNAAIGELLKYSLVRRDPAAGILTIHRLVQVVIKDAMDEHTQLQWVERSVRALDKVLSTIDFKVWGKAWRQCEQYLPHAQVCAALIKQWNIVFLEAAQLLYRAGTYLCDSGQYEQAESLLQQALTIRKKVLGEEHREIAESLNGLSWLYIFQLKFTEAESLAQQALTICKKVLGEKHRDTARSFSYLAMAYQAEGQNTEAEALLQHALTIRQKVLGEDDLDTAESYNILGTLYLFQNRYEEARPLLLRDLAICQKVLGVDPRTARSLNCLAMFYMALNDYEKVESYFQQALAIYQKILGPDHPSTAAALTMLANVYFSQGGYNQAEVYYQQALAIYEKVGSPEYSVAVKSSLADVYASQGKYAQAQVYYEQALAIYQKEGSSVSSFTVAALIKLANVYVAQGKNDQAEPYYLQALDFYQKTAGPDHPYTASQMSILANFYFMQGKYAQAQMYYQQALDIFQRTLGFNHPYTLNAHNGLLKASTALAGRQGGTYFC